MRVFVLCTGRCGSTTFIRACKHVSNYSAGHETLARAIGDARFLYPENHIEADNRLSWFLGDLDQRFGNDAFYVHLVRDKEATIRSFNLRWNQPVSIMDAFSEGILMKRIETLSEQERLKVCSFYYDTVNNNISSFLSGKSKKQTIRLENITEDFMIFWENIAAEGDIVNALTELSNIYNAS